MTRTQKILAKHAGLGSVKAGDVIEANLDIALANDITGPVSIKELEKIGVYDVFDKEKVVFVMSHFAPNKDIKSAEQCLVCRKFAQKANMTHFYDVGEMGIEHCLLPEKGIVTAGDLVIGADSHTCTYGALGAFSTGAGSTDIAFGMATGKSWFKVPSAMKIILKGKPKKWVCGKDIILNIIGKIGVDGALYKSMEYFGDGIKYLNMDDRFTICNMAIEAGAKNGIFPVDEITLEYIKEHGNKPYEAFEADEDAYYDEVLEIDLEAIRPTVALPHLPENTKFVDEIDEIKIDQVVIGSCTNGRISDLRTAAEILKDKKVAKNCRTIIIPGSQGIYLQALQEGLIEIFIKANAIVSTPTCGPCLGGHTGILAKGEKCLSTTNRNFVGRMGHSESFIYLTSPAVAAASAITGIITDPNKI